MNWDTLAEPRPVGAGPGTVPRAIDAGRRLPTLRFFLRYPLFLLAFGPPVFKAPLVGFDTSQAHFDLWNVLQVGWLAAIALRALLRLSAARSIALPPPIRSILKVQLILGIFFLASVIYSSGRIVSTEYALIFFLNLACIFEFLVDAYWSPPDWLQCIFELRRVALLLIGLVVLTLLIAPGLVLHVQPGEGVRLMGGSVANMALYPEIVAITSTYTFLYSLERKSQAALFLLIGLGGSLITQTRGVEIALPAILFLIAAGWARSSKRAGSFSLSALTIVLLGFLAAVSIVGMGRIWQVFNRGQDIATITTASGRTGVWKDQIQYCVTHPQGMGYIAGVRAFRRRDFATNLHASLTNIGGTDNSFMQVLTDAGWPALALYLVVLGRTLVLGRNAARRGFRAIAPSGIQVGHAVRCGLFLLLFCLAAGMESSMYVIPMFGSFYCQNILIAVILGGSMSLLIASRPRHLPAAS